MITKINQILNEVFGYKSFRPNQKEIIETILYQKDTLVVMPTGGGKSLCYQIPAIALDGLTIVISPLISLMKDQVEQLKLNGVKAVFLNSSLSRDEYEYNIGEILSGNVNLLYLAPETLVSERVVNLLKKIKPVFVTIDEAHCISEWGHDFRPEYRKIVFLKEMFPGITFAAFTATATEKVRDDIAVSLQLSNPEVFISSFNRKNLYLEVVQKTRPLNQILKFLQRYPGKTGIIYCFSRKQVDSLAEDLQAEGYKALPYHAGLSDSLRSENQQKFVNDEIQIIVATIAFGMGIDKSNVRFVIHHDLPKNLESYYQEIGRSGRDGLFAHCLLLYSEKDTSKIQYFINQKENYREREIAENQLQKVVDFSDYYYCRRKPLLRYFGEEITESNCNACDNCNTQIKKQTDLTIAAQKFLSCVIRTKENFPKEYIVDLLLGKESQEVKNKRHTELSTFGIGKEFSADEWKMLAGQFIKSNLITSHPAPSVTPKGKEVLKNKELFMGYLPSKRKEVKRKTIISSVDEKLFDELVEVRRYLAQKFGIPPYTVFSDNTLTEMASRQPVTRGEMMEINGVAFAKYEKFGAIFINTIKKFVGGKDSSDTKPAVKISGSAYQIGEKINEGATLQTLLVETKLRKTTILKHILSYVEAGNEIPVEFVKKNWKTRADVVDRITVLKENGMAADLREFLPAAKQEDQQWFDILSKLFN